MAKKADNQEAEAPALHVVAGNTPYFGDDNVLHHPGELVYALPSAAGDNLEPTDGAEVAAMSEVRIANVAPSGGGSNPQGLPPGSRESGAGAFVSKGTPGTDGVAQNYVPQDGPNVATTADGPKQADKAAEKA